MSGITCDRIRAAALDPGTRPADWSRQPDAAAHLRQCADCRDWLAAFAAGERAWAVEPGDDFAAEVIARTAGVEAVLRDLPLLAELDPGPGFTGRVLMATSRRPAPEGWRGRAAAAWWALVRRPRFAWEAAYLATVCWVLVFGNPVGAIEWSTSNIGAVARERLAPPVREWRADLENWRATFSAESPPPGDTSRAPGALAPPVVRAWEAAVEWLRQASTSIIDAIARGWDAIAAWIDGPDEGAAPRPTEPPPGTARSHQ
ncbi:MAG: hypothetical protein ACM3H9_01425 [Rhodospirillaceae bacterium]